MFTLTPVVRQLLIINAMVFIACNLMPDLQSSLVMYAPTSEPFKPFQIVTCMFTHANFGHILMNMIGLINFGPQLEMVIGERKFLMLYFITGLGAILLHYLLAYWGVGFDVEAANASLGALLGASGAIFGLLAAYGILFYTQEVQLLFPPVRMNVLLLVLIYVGLQFMQVGDSNIAFNAHIGGAMIGFAMAFLWGYRIRF